MIYLTFCHENIDKRNELYNSAVITFANDISVHKHIRS